MNLRRHPVKVLVGLDNFKYCCFGKCNHILVVSNPPPAFIGIFLIRWIIEKPAVIFKAAINIMGTDASGLLKFGQRLPANSVPRQIISCAEDGTRGGEGKKNGRR